MCGEPISVNARVCKHCGEELKPKKKDGDAVSHVIPYKNPAALFAYYCGIFSVIPCFALGITAFILGIIGLRAVKRNPELHGTAHAWIGIVTGFLFGGFWTLVTILGVIGAIAASNQRGF
jgi:hypothetical protein